ncbi:hypothetical protein G7054_g2760 [Neopestalotiopsis clavispora]|nr:hypothetical protein G7054_g2760 [Neopestalotiopsis clavispora]
MGRVRKHAASKQGGLHAVVRAREHQSPNALPFLKQIFNIQGLIFRPGAIMEDRKEDIKIRNALCEGAKVRISAVVNRRMTELYNKLWAKRHILYEDWKDGDHWGN